MTVLNAADALFLGDVLADAVYLGGAQVWPSVFSPASLPGLVSWLDAKDYTPGSWPNKGTGPAVTIESTPPMTVSANKLNGRPLVRFTKDQGRLRSTWPYERFDWTLVYLVRWVGPNAGRAFSVQYPPSNLLVGMHTSQPDTAYYNGAFLTPGTSWGTWSQPGPWRMYGGDSTIAGQRFFIDGVQIGSPYAGGYGFDVGWGISGYEASTAETIDIEVAELVLYNRKLSDTERVQVEEYLQAKWFGPPPPLYDPDTQAYLTATGLDAATYGEPLDNLVLDLKATGLWSKMKAIYPFVGGTAELHKWNLKDPRDTDDAYRLTFTGGVHSTDFGWRPNLSGNSFGYKADSHLVPLGTLAQDSTHMAMYSLLDVAPADRCDMGAYNWGGSQERFNLIAQYNGNAFYYGMADNSAPAIASAGASSGLFVSTRTGQYAQAAYRNGVKIGSSANPSIPLPPGALTVGGLTGYAQGPSNLPFGFASIGSGLDDRNVSDLYNVVQAFQTDLNRQV